LAILEIGEVDIQADDFALTRDKMDCTVLLGIDRTGLTDVGYKMNE
jgi:hypothetical protein